jgi:uncharacterized Zn-finger protein
MSFKLKGNLKSHLLIHSGIKYDYIKLYFRRYRCKFCNKGFSRPGRLKQHEDKHSSGLFPKKILEEIKLKKKNVFILFI